MKLSGVIWCLVFELAFGPLRMLAAQEQTGAEKLRIMIVEGEGAMNNITVQTPRNLVVEVHGEDNQPVANASVVFTVPAQGASGRFRDGSTTLTLQSDAKGRAAAAGFRPNAVAGKMEIRVNASYQGQTGRAVITQFNMQVSDPASVAAKKKSGSGKTVAILVGIAGAAAAGGVLAATRGKSSSSPSTPTPPAAISVAAGTGSVGPPQ